MKTMATTSESADKSMASKVHVYVCKMFLVLLHASHQIVNIVLQLVQLSYL